MKHILSIYLLTVSALFSEPAAVAPDGTGISNPAFRAAVLSGSGVSETELGYLDGVTGHVADSGDVTALESSIDGKLDNTNAAINTAIAENPAASLSAIGAAPASIQSAAESLPYKILVRDDMRGANATVAQAGTRACVPGPGTMTASYSPNQSLVRYEDGSLLLAHIPPSGNGPTVTWDGQTIAPGLTAKFIITPSNRSGLVAQTFLGVCDVNSTAAGRARRGAVQLTWDSGASNTKVPLVAFSTLASATDDTLRIYRRYLFTPGERVAVAVRYAAADRIEYFIQSPVLANLGCAVGDEGWFKMGETSGVTLSGTVYPFVHSQFGGVAQIHSVEVMSEWTPSPRHQCFDYDRTKLGIHCPALCVDPASGLLVAAWNNGSAHVGTDVAIRAAVRKADGTWTDAQTLVAAPGAPAGISIGSLSVVNGQLWLTSWHSAAAEDGGVLRRRILTVGSDGVISVGAEQVLSGLDSGDDKLAFNPIIQSNAGTYLLPYHNQTAPLTYHVARSTDNGATWTSVQIAASMPAGTTWLVEPTVIVEPDGAIGCYMRSTANFIYYARSTDDGLTWSTPAAVPGIPNASSNGERVQARRSPNGRLWLVGGDDRTDRRAVTVWEIGASGKILGKHPLIDTGGAASNAGIEQYPALLFDEDDLWLAYSFQASAGGELSTAIQLHALRWPDEPVAREAGGSGLRGKSINASLSRNFPQPYTQLTYAATMTPDLAINSRYYVTLTGTPATGIAVPLNPLPWETLQICFVQGGSGSYTCPFNAIFEFGGITASWQTAVGSTNMVTATYNPLTNKWIVTMWR